MSSTERAFSSHDTAGYVGFANLPNQVHRKSVKNEKTEQNPQTLGLRPKIAT